MVGVARANKKRAFVIDQDIILRADKAFDIIDLIEILEKEIDEDLIDDQEDIQAWGEWSDEDS